MAGWQQVACGWMSLLARVVPVAALRARTGFARQHPTAGRGGAALRAAIALVGLSACGPGTREVERVLEEANYCSRVEAIEELRDEYRPRCVYKCFPSAGVACVDGGCEPVYRPYWLPAAQVPGAPLVGGSP